MPKDVNIDSREYKLLLEPKRFAEELPAVIAARLWNGEIKRAIGKLDARHRHKPRQKGDFNEPEERSVLFWDTTEGLLDECGYVLRERFQSGDPDHEVTLKFRSPDIILAAEAKPPGAKKRDTKFEEDIAPLQVRFAGSPDQSSVIFAQPPSMRSQFSVSTTQSVEPHALKKLKHVLELYRTLKDNLERIAVGDIDEDAKLISGMNIRELVFKGAKVDFGGDTNAKFSLTLWYDGAAARTMPPIAAEISFKYEMDEGRSYGKIAQRALTLFSTMQTELAEWIDRRQISKTALVLPKAHARVRT